MSRLTFSAACLFSLAALSPAFAQTAPVPAPSSDKEFFISWGYNGDTYSKSDMHFKQPSLGNDFTLVGVQARDSKAWTDGLFAHALTVPQYNFRFGLFFNEKWGFEVSVDHIKWIVKDGQVVRMTGTLNNEAVDTDVTLTPEVLKYQLNNGANPIFFNLLRRWRLAGEPRRFGHLVFLGKAGGGFAIPHTENHVFDQPNDPGFQPFHGWNLDVAAAARLHLWKGLYFEFEEKLLYAKYYGVNIDQGEAGHNVKASEFNWNFGWSFK